MVAAGLIDQQKPPPGNVGSTLRVNSYFVFTGVLWKHSYFHNIVHIDPIAGEEKTVRSTGLGFNIGINLFPFSAVIVFSQCDWGNPLVVMAPLP